MNKLLLWLVVILGLAGFVAVSLESCNDSQANRLYAEAALTGAKSAARMDMMAGLMPYAVLGLVVFAIVLTVSLVIFGLVHMANVRATQPVQVRQGQLPPVVNHNYFLVAGADVGELSNRRILKQLTANKVIRR